ncbi:ABC transporter ATP-binding protein [Xanthobacteraceae bacterium A53D]
MLDVKSLNVAYGNIPVLHDVSLSVQPGTLAALVGANGAGKTTLLRAISGITRPSSGDIVFDGASVVGRKPEETARRGLVHVPQGRQIVPGLTVEQNLCIGALHLKGIDREEMKRGIEREYERFPILHTRRHLPGTSLSGGEQQMLAVSRALMMRPRALMLDEPSLGLAPKIVRTILDELERLAASGVAVLLVEQAALAALEIAHTGYVIKGGRIVMHDTGSALSSNKALVQSYLG